MVRLTVLYGHSTDPAEFDFQHLQDMGLQAVPGGSLGCATATDETILARISH